MARKISQFDNGGSATGDYPNGYIIDNPGDGSGTKANSKSNNDLQQLMQQLMIGSGVVPNGLPDNTTNGFQLYTALKNTFSYPINVATISLAGTYTFATHQLSFIGSLASVNAIVLSATGAVAGSEVILYGTVTAGQSITLSSAGNIYNVSGASALTFSNTGSVCIRMICVSKAGSGSFVVEIYNQDYGAAINTINAAITALTPSIWTSLTAINGWSGTGGSTPKYTKDGLGNVSIQGLISIASGTPSSPVFAVLDISHRPSQTLQLSSFGSDFGTGLKYPILIEITTAGNMQIVTSTFNPTAVNSFFTLDGLNFNTL